MDLSPLAPRPQRAGAVCWLPALVALLGLTAPAGAADIVKSRASYHSGGKEIQVERFEPAGNGPFPAVVLLHGSNGPEWHGKDYRDYAELLAGKGYVALFIHYFDRTGTREADRPSIKENYLFWMVTVSDAVVYAGTLPNVDRKRVGLLGFSLGSYLSLSLAALRGKEHIAAVAEYVGGLPDTPLNNIKKMPPVLILHGEKDDVVSVQEARDLDALLTRNAVPHEIKLYAEQKHLFLGDDAQDASERVLRFLEKHLKKSPVVEK